MINVLTSDILTTLSGSNGLSSDQVTLLRNTHGENVLTPPKRDPLWKQYFAQFESPLIRILILAVIVSGVIAVIEKDGYLDTVAIFIAVFLATGISFASEYKSNREFEVLNAHRDDIPVKVIRDGMPRIIPARDVVVGDLILLEAGDIVPADGYCRGSDGLFLDEATFTGESEPIRKKTDDELYKGTFVRGGKGQMQSAAVGDATRMGTIAQSLGIDHTTPTPLTEKLTGLAGIISWFGYIMAALIILSLLIRGYFMGDISGLNLDTARHLVNYLILAVTIIVVAVPEGLPMSVALSLSLAMQKMTRAHCLVRKLVACETIGSATIICTDKTGTLTKNQMDVVESSTGNPVAVNELPHSPQEWVTLNAAVNSTAHINTENGTPVIIGNITEGALLRWLEDAGIDYRAVRAGYPVLTQQLFDGTRKRMSSVITINDRQWLLVKGAPEIIASRCTVSINLDTVNASAARAMRTLAFAHREIVNGDEDETGLTWDGYVGIRDAIRENIGSSVATCHRAGVRVCMVTGDNPETAKAIAIETGILKTGSVMTGAEFRDLPKDQQVIATRDLEVMARAEPLDKLLLVRALQQDHHVVAVTGDGINDAPALKHADVGLAMGQSGTDVAREASDLILLDDSFATIASGILWGRSLFENIQRFLVFQLTINIAACFLVFLFALMGYPSPFTIIQILWINIIMDTLAAFALCSEAPHPGLMTRPPVPRTAPIITRFMWMSILVTAAFLILMGIVHLRTGFLGGSTAAEASTVFFAAFIIAQVYNGLNCRALNGEMPPLLTGNWIFFAVMGIIVAATVIMVQVGGEVFGTVPLSLGQWVQIIVVTASVLVLGYLLRSCEAFLNRRDLAQSKK